MRTVNAYAAPSATEPLVPTTIERRDVGPHDVLIEIAYAGICHSDIHTVRGDWGDITYPQVVGHEIVGTVAEVGSEVTSHKVGDRVGVGCMVNSCRECENCLAGEEQYCEKGNIGTYGAKDVDGTITQGGYSEKIVVDENYVMGIPEGIELDVAAPLLCAGITLYSPLKHWGAGPGKKVAIVGMGGLGHYAVLWAVALGAEVYVLSHTPGKKEDALKMGAKEFAVTSEKDWQKKYAFTFDFILNCADATDRFDLPAYFSTLKVMGKFHNVGFGDKPLPQLMAQDFAPNGCYIGASHIGNRPEMLAMLDLASKQEIHSWISTVPISAEGCKEVVERVYNNKDVRYRLVLNNFDEAFGKRE